MDTHKNKGLQETEKKKGSVARYCERKESEKKSKTSHRAEVCAGPICALLCDT